MSWTKIKTDNSDTIIKSIEIRTSDPSGDDLYEGRIWIISDPEQTGS